MKLFITGGSGALGSALVRTALGWPGVERVAVFSRDEHKQQALLAALGPDPADRLRFFLGDVRDQGRLEQAMHGTTHVVHAAALKVVPWLEYSPTEGVKTNVNGAAHVVDAAIRSGVEKVIGVSSDKATAPLNLYGATKLVAEKLFLAANALAGGRTKFAVVRYGNVTGSTGSVVRAWRPMAKEGRPLPLTDDRMTRFWMTLAEAVELIRTALYDARGGEIIIPKLLSYRVRDLGKAVWGEQNPEDQWAAQFKAVGLRPGEKLHESMISDDESPWTYDCGGHYEIVHATDPNGPGGRTVAAVINGSKVKDGFSYRSDRNGEFMPVADLRARLAGVP